MTIILFNGPPRAGKDTAGEIAMDFCRNHDLHAVHDKLSGPIKIAFAATSSTRWDGTINHDWEHRKEEIIPLFGVSYRQWQIDFSEKFMKPLYGNDVFSKLLLSRMETFRDVAHHWIISDCGFQNEYETLARKLGRDNVHVCRIKRPNCTFEGDSRNYVYATGSRCFQNETLIENNAGLTEFKSAITTMLKRVLA